MEMGREGWNGYYGRKKGSDKNMNMKLNIYFFLTQEAHERRTSFF